MTRRKRGGWSSRADNLWEKMTRKHIAGEIIEDKVCFRKGVCADSSLCRLISSDKTDLFFFLVLGEHLPHKKFMPCFQPDREKAQSSSCIYGFSIIFSSKTILMRKCHIWRWHMLISFIQSPKICFLFNFYLFLLWPFCMISSSSVLFFNVDSSTKNSEVLWQKQVCHRKVQIFKNVTLFVCCNKTSLISYPDIIAYEEKFYSC